MCCIVYMETTARYHIPRRKSVQGPAYLDDEDSREQQRARHNYCSPSVPKLSELVTLLDVISLYRRQEVEGGCTCTL